MAHKARLQILSELQQMVVISDKLRLPRLGGFYRINLRGSDMSKYDRDINRLFKMTVI